MGIWRVSAWPCTSSTVLVRGLLEGTATFMFSSCWSDQAQDGAETAYLKNFRPFDRIWLEARATVARPSDRRNSSNAALNHIGGEPCQYAGPCAQGRQSSAGAGFEFARARFGC